MSILKGYSVNNSSTKVAELFEIANKYRLFRKSAKRLRLKIAYEIALFLAKFLAKEENKKGVSHAKS